MANARELAKMLRETADLYDELANIEENTELDKQQKEEAQETVIGKIVVKMMKIKQ